jgi:hypothetical protein
MGDAFSPPQESQAGINHMRALSQKGAWGVLVRAERFPQTATIQRLWKDRSNL